MTHQRTNSIDHAIVGGGPASVSYLLNLFDLLRNTPHPVRMNVTVYEKAPRCGPGLAFSPELDPLVLNQRMSTMGLLYNNPSGFKSWLSAHASRWKKRYPNLDPSTDEHPQRSLYGEYASDELEQLRLRASRRGHRIEIIHEEVTHCREEGNRIIVQTKSGAIRSFDKVVLALGNLPAHTHAHLRGLPGYLHSPWPIGRLQAYLRERAGQHIYIFGSALSAIDTANALAEMGHQGNITLISRHGTPPKVLGPPPPVPYQLRHLTKQRLREILAQTKETTGREHVPLVEVIELLRRELECCFGMPTRMLPWTDILLGNADVGRALEEDLRLAQHPIPWQAMLRATLPIVDCIWHLLSPEDQRTFEGYRSIWNRYRHAMARPTAERFLRLLQTGQVEVLGGLKENGSQPDGDGRSAILRLDGKCPIRAPRHAELQRRHEESGAEWVLRAQCMINATGQGTRIPELCRAGLAGDLLKNMLDEGTISPHPAGGVRIDELWRPLNRNGEPAQHLLVLGHLTMGTLFYVSGMDKIAALAHDTATVLLRMLEVEIPAQRMFAVKKEIVWPC
jgi:uncharacterized NAD(P)/FAD-binding protein YdhS